MRQTLKRWRDLGYQNIYGTDVLRGWCADYRPAHDGPVRILDVGCGPGRDLAARREAYSEGAASGSLARPVRAWDDDLDARAAGSPTPARPTRPIIPGERQFRDGDRVRHARWGDGIVVTSKLTRSDEEVTVAFKDASVGRKTMLVSLANLDLVG